MARNIAKKVEEKRVNFIINEVNENTPLGISIRNNLENMTTEQLKKIAKNLQKIEGMLA